MLEAVRSRGTALQHADWALQQDPMLQPASVERNCLAGQRCRAPMARVSAMSILPDDSIEAWVSFGFAGSQCSLVCGAGRTLGDLASALVEHYSVECGLVHMTSPSGQRFSPLDVYVAVKALT